VFFFFFFAFQLRWEHKKESQEFCEGKKPLSYGLRLTLGSCWHHFLSIFGEGAGGGYQVESVLWQKSTAFQKTKHLLQWAFYFSKMPNLFFHIYFLCEEYPSDTPPVCVCVFFGLGVSGVKFVL